MNKKIIMRKMDVKDTDVNPNGIIILETEEKDGKYIHTYAVGDGETPYKDLEKIHLSTHSTGNLSELDKLMKILGFEIDD